jgi:hypothetical protein
VVSQTLLTVYAMQSIEQRWHAKYLEDFYTSSPKPADDAGMEATQVFEDLVP